MKKLLAPLTALAFVFSVAVAQAEEAGGKIAAVDSYAGTLVLQDGTTFTIAQGVSMEGLQPGTEVILSFEEQDGKLIVTEIALSN